MSERGDIVKQIAEYVKGHFGDVKAARAAVDRAIDETKTTKRAVIFNHVVQGVRGNDHGSGNPGGEMEEIEKMERNR